MPDHVPELLLGYLLGALEESEREMVENRLKRNPGLKNELALMRERLFGLWAAQPDYVPPSGLAARTCEHVASKAFFDSGRASRVPEPVEMEVVPQVEAAGAGRLGSSRGWLDLGVALGVVLAASVLILPAIQESRFDARLSECQEHLRRLGLGLAQYSEQHQGFFPQVSDQGRLAGAGIYAPMLLSTEYVDGSRWFVCPESSLADEKSFDVPTLDTLLATPPGAKLDRLRRVMGGSYGYGLGYIEGERYKSPRNLRRPYHALMSDKPSRSLPDFQSDNHGGLGQNVLFEDGRVVFYRLPQPHAEADHLFVNESGLVAAGTHRNDSVIGASEAIPSLPVVPTSAQDR